jgi:hypothetical protein
MPPCPGCGLTIEATAAFCPTCGWRAPAAQSGRSRPTGDAAADPRGATDVRSAALGEVWAGGDPSPHAELLRPATRRQKIAGVVLLIVVIVVEVVVWRLVVGPWLVRLLRPAEGHVAPGFFYGIYLLVSTIASITAITMISPQLAEPIWSLLGLNTLRSNRD